MLKSAFRVVREERSEQTKIGGERNVKHVWLMQDRCEYPKLEPALSNIVRLHASASLTTGLFQRKVAGAPHNTSVSLELLTIPDAATVNWSQSLACDCDNGLVASRY